MAKSDNFPRCSICSSDDWQIIYSGPVRNGTPGEEIEADVCRCGTCGVERLSEGVCQSHSNYEGSAYRLQLGQDHDINNHYHIHDELSRYTLETIWPVSLRGKTVADVGCAGGSLLDHISGVTSKLLAIEPGVGWAASLIDRGYSWYPSIKEAAEKYARQVDVVISTQVIEHVEDPRQFIVDIGELLKPDGVAIISTPNRADILMELLPNTFKKFFYRSQHRWAFDAKSLGACTAYAGLQVKEVRHVHRYGLANAMYWLKDASPKGRSLMPPLDDAIDLHWKAWLESTARSDNLYIVVSRKDGGGL